MVLIIGPGAVGTILAAYLSRAGQPVNLLIREKYRAGFEAAPALRVDRVGGSTLTAPKPVFTTSLDLTGVDTVMVCVKFPDLDALLTQLPPLPANLTLISALNGVAASRLIRQRLPAAKIVTMSVMYNGQLLAPLHAQLTTNPQVIIGSEDQKLLSLFDGSGMQVKRARGDDGAWGKLLINLANAVCALTHTTFKDLFTQHDLRAIYAGVLDEAIGLMEKSGVPYQLPMPLPYPAFRAMLLHGGPLPWWVAKLKNGVQEGAYPSMVADLDSGRKTEVDQLNGEIVRLGLEHRTPTPVNAKIVELVHELEAQKGAKYLQPKDLRTRLLA